MEQKRKQLLLKIVRGNDFSRALKAIAELRMSSDSALVSALAQAAVPDEQRKFQVRVATVALQRGIKGLVDEWATFGDAKWRAELISEIGQFVDLWVEGHHRVSPRFAERLRPAGSSQSRMDAACISEGAVRQGKSSGQKRVATAISRWRCHGAWLDNDRAAVAHYASALGHAGAAPPGPVSRSTSDRGDLGLYCLQDESDCD
jgi:hypothetical protein